MKFKSKPIIYIALIVILILAVGAVYMCNSSTHSQISGMHSNISGCCPSIEKQ